MIVEIDHLLVAARDPEAAAAGLAAALGIARAGGGVHAAIGTRNALLSLAGPYLEVIGLADDDPTTLRRASRHPIGAAVVEALAALGDAEDALAYVTMALRTDAAVADSAALAAAGHVPGSVSEVARARPDGSVVRWPVVLPAHLGPDVAPFLIEHAPDEPERAARIAGGGPRLASIEIAVPDPEAVAGSWTRSLGIASAPAGERRELRVGPHRVLLAPSRGLPGRAVLRVDGPVGVARTATRGSVTIELG